MSDNQLALEAESLSLGESTQVYCPFCDNAAPYSKSMSLTRVETGAVFYCFRPVCNASGHVSMNGRVSRAKKKHDSINRYKEYACSLVPISSVSNGLCKQGWSNEGIMFNVNWRTVAFPVYDYYGTQFGWVDRSYSGRVPKSINYIDDSKPKVHFPLAFDRDVTDFPSGLRSVHIVEDIPSAIAVCRYANCVSILGTSMANDVLEELQRRFDSITICLDKDATAKAVKLKRVLRSLFKRVYVKFLPKDPKDMDDEELQAYFGE